MHIARLLPLLPMLACTAPRASPTAPARPSPLALAPSRAVAWSWTGGGARTDWITRVVATRDGDVVAVGFVDRDDSGESGDWNAVAMRFAPDGRLRWSRTFGGAAIDAFWDAREEADGRIAIAGFSASAGTGAQGGADAWLVVLDGAGATLLDRRYGGGAEDLALGIADAPDGGWVLAGQTRSEGAGERDVLLVRVDSSGGERWRRTFGGPGVDRGFYVARRPGTAAGFVVAGVTGAERAYDMLVLAVDDAGAQLWRRVAGGEGNDPNHGLVVYPDGRVLVLGYTEERAREPVHDLVALTLAGDDGRVLRHETLGGAGDDRAMGGFVDASGATWVAGYTRSAGAGAWDVLLARVRPDGAFEPWIAAVGTAHDDQAYAGAMAADGTLLLGGYTTAPSAGAAPPDLLLMRVRPERIARNTAGVTARRIE